MVIFTIVWVFTFGKHHFWLLPNLTEDVGFFESFWPLYKHHLRGEDNKDNKDKDRDQKKKKRKDSDETVPLVTAEDKNLVENKDKESGSESASTVESLAKSNSSNELSLCSKDSTNGINGFEILDSKELEDNSEEEETVGQ